MNTVDDDLRAMFGARAATIPDDPPADPYPPISQAVSRSRRRRGAGFAVIGVAAASALAVAVLPGSASTPTEQVASTPVTIKPAAWTVNLAPGGVVSVTLRELADPQGLQRALRAAGVPAVVNFDSACVPDAGNTLGGAISMPDVDADELTRVAVFVIAVFGSDVTNPSFHTHKVFDVHPAAIPAGKVLFLSAGDTLAGADQPAGVRTAADATVTPSAAAIPLRMVLARIVPSTEPCLR